jgi:hypothetical protein
MQLMIIAGTLIDIRNGTQMTLLALASSEGKVEAECFLIHRGADLNVWEDAAVVVAGMTTH